VLFALKEESTSYVSPVVENLPTNFAGIVPLEKSLPSSEAIKSAAGIAAVSPLP
jgi:hypothetical protein